MEPEVVRFRGMKRKVYYGGEDEDVTAKRGCLLNSAASDASKGAAKILSSLRQSTNVDECLDSIASDVIFMEESLYGLTVGPFKHSSYRNQWRKRVVEAASLSEIKGYLLEFERNIRNIAFSSDWISQVADTNSESQLSQSANRVVGSVKRLGRKPSISTDFVWWRGGMLSKHMIRYAARQGGCKKINGVHYVDSHEALKRSKQFIWRAAVDLSQTASELALQVSYLDLHIRWNELVCPEQPLQDGKVLDLQASAFRNACIIDKKYIGKKLSYGVVFENQKHLPSHLLKKVLEVEETGDRKSKNWFLETQIPLYLIKEYEMVAVADVKLPDSDIKNVTKSSKLSKKQLQASGKNLFSFLEHKRENMGNVFCTFCQRDVSFRVAAKCSSCQGYCHDECAVGTYNIQTASRIEFIVTCKRCSDIEKDVTPENDIVSDSPTSPLLSQGQESQHSPSLIKQNGHESPLEYSNPISSQPEISTTGNKNSQNQPLQSVDQKPEVSNSSKESPLLLQGQESQLSISSQPEIGANGKKNSQHQPLQSVDQKPEVFNSSKRSKKKDSKYCLGLIWKKRSPDDTGTEFRKNNILLKGSPRGHLLAPTCHLCKQVYDFELMYILCETCKNWFHADSVDLQESKVIELFGYKCCKCRRIGVPICPHTDPDTRRSLEARKEAYARAQMKKNLGYNSDLDPLLCFESYSRI